MLRQKNRHVPSFLHHKQQANKAQQMANNLAKVISYYIKKFILILIVNPFIILADSV